MYYDIIIAKFSDDHDLDYMAALDRDVLYINLGDEIFMSYTYKLEGILCLIA